MDFLFVKIMILCDIAWKSSFCGFCDFNPREDGGRGRMTAAGDLNDSFPRRERTRGQGTRQAKHQPSALARVKAKPTLQVMATASAKAKPGER